MKKSTVSLIVVFLIILLLGSMAFFFIAGDLKLLTNQTKTYSVISFNPGVRQKIVSGSILTGKGISNSTVEVYLIPGSQKTVQTDKEGTWRYQLPKGLSSGSYILSVVILDKIKTIASIKTYRITVVDNRWRLPFISLHSIPLFHSNKVSAQGADYDWERAVGPNWSSWLTLMHDMDIYPAIENGQIILYSQKMYQDTYCQSQLCSFSPRSLSDWQNELSQDADFFRYLVLYINQDGYRIEALKQYFPFLENYIHNIDKIGVPAAQTPKDSIDEATLINYINKVAIEYGYSEKEIFKNILNTFDPIVGSRSIYNVATGYAFINTNDYINAVGGLLMLAPYAGVPLKAAIRETRNIVIDYARMVKDVSIIRQSIKEDGFVAYDIIVKGRGDAWYNSNILPRSKYGQGLVLTRSDIPIPNFNAEARPSFNKYVWPAIRKGEGFTISRGDVLEPVSKNIKRAVEAFQVRTRRSLPLNTGAPDNMVKNSTAYVVPLKYLPSDWGGFRSGEMIVLSTERYNSTRGLGSLHHEMIHMIGGSKKGFFYGGSSERDKIFTAIYELMTDAWADIAMGQEPLSAGSHLATGGYASQNPKIVDTMYNRLFRSNPRLMDDFLEFAISGDSDKLIDRVVSYVGNNQSNKYNTFVSFFKDGRGVNFAAITYVGAVRLALDQAQGQSIQAFDPNNPTFPDDVYPAFTINDDFIIDNYDKILAEVDNSVQTSGLNTTTGTSEIQSVIINGQIVDLTDPQFVTVNLDPNNRIVPIAIELSDNSTRYLGLTFTNIQQ